MNYRDLATRHEKLADQYAQTAHRFQGEMAAAYGAASQAHRHLSTVLNGEADRHNEPAEGESHAGTKDDNLATLTAGLGRPASRKQSAAQTRAKAAADSEVQTHPERQA